MSLGNRITELEEGKKIIDLGRGRIYLGEGKAEVFLTKDEVKDLCYSLLLMGYDKELRYKTEPLFDILSEVEEDLKLGSDGTGILKLENSRLTLGYKNRYEDITEIANKEGFSFWHYIHALGLERTGLAGGESPYEFEEEESEKTSLRKKFGALGIIGLIAGAAGGFGIYSGIKNLAKKGYEKDYITLKEIAEENNPELIKKYTLPLGIGKGSVSQDMVDKNNQIVAAWTAGYRDNKKFVEIQIFGYESNFENFIKQLDASKIPYKPKTYKELHEELNLPSSSEHLDDIYSVLIPAEEFFKNKEKLVKLINQSTGIDEKIIAKDVNQLGLKVKYLKLLNNVSLEIMDYNEIDVENATPPFGDALELKKILWDFDDNLYSKILENPQYNEAEFENLVKSLLEKEGYSIENLNKMKTKDVLKVLAKLIEDNVEYDEKAKPNTPYETLKTGKGVCSDYSDAYKAVKKVLESYIPKLKNVRIGRIGSISHEWNYIMYFDGNKLIISPVDLTWDDADGIPLGSKDNNTFTDLSAIDEYHCFPKN
mgnify:CR=1 FL=1